MTNDAGDDPRPQRPRSVRRPPEDGASTQQVPRTPQPRPSQRATGPATQRVPATPAAPRSTLLDAVPEVERPTVVGPIELPEIVPGDPTDAVARARRPIVRQGTPRARVRRVTRVVRHIDTWSVFKVALVFHLFLYTVLLSSGVLLWKVAENTGTLDNVEQFFESFGWQTFELRGGEIFHNAWIAGLFVVVGLTGLAVLAATLFNLITDLVGGIRVSVLEEEVVAREHAPRAGLMTGLIDRVRQQFR